MARLLCIDLGSMRIWVASPNRVRLRRQITKLFQKGLAMKRDMNLIRRIALATADLSLGETLTELNGVPDDEFALHAVWMNEAGLVKGIFNEAVADKFPYVEIGRLTWDGCNFADEVRSETLWKKAQENVLLPSMSFTFSVLREWLKAEIVKGIPTLGGGG